ncbi:adenosylcobinamide-GDP ribazoletransferase [Granulicoccus phenolivorans]|uniref:adenosylcobinamide-GDP ribazoletransferase n=1 Tax=Granulicoccus phenolivorans TaxID=266854 RepID=UPI000407842F|nr:adenosylcobinamide-GDP ribazoletransferase [Granulicoccus phenolivorans]
MSRWRDGLRLAVGTLTVLPTRVIPSRGIAGYAMALAPIAVLPLGGLAALVAALGSWARLPGLLTGLLVLGAIVLGTRAMHVDAVADVADALGGGWTPERAREILKRGDVGPMGVTALLLLLGCQAVAIGELAGTGAFGWILIGATVVLSRSALAWSARVGLPAMPGSSLGALMAETLPRWAGAAWTLLAAGALAALGRPAGLAWWQGPAAAVLAAVVCWGFTGLCRRRFGGINGDVMGAGIELSWLALLLVCLVGK